MFAIAVIEPGRIKVVEIPRPAPGSCDALVKNKVAYICNATDRKLVAGHFPGTGPDRYPCFSATRASRSPTRCRIPVSSPRS